MAITLPGPDGIAPLICHPDQSSLPAIRLRPESEEDVEFTRDLYVSTRWDELAAVAWPDSSKLAFLHDQFRLQRAHYRSGYHDASFQLILTGEEPIGRLYVHRGTSEYRVVDISLLPGWRGRGVGGYLLRSLQADARNHYSKVSIHVEINNPAQRLYRRLGFQPVEDKGIYALFEWCAQSKSI